MKRSLSASGLVLAALVGGCATVERSPVATAGQGELVVMCQLKSGVDSSAVVPAANTLAKLPGVIDVSAAVDSTSGTRIAFVATFKNRDAANAASAAVPKAMADAGYSDKIEKLDAYSGTLQNYLVSEAFTQETTAADLQRRSAAIKQQREMYDRTK